VGVVYSGLLQILLHDRVLGAAHAVRAVRLHLPFLSRITCLLYSTLMMVDKLVALVLSVAAASPNSALVLQQLYAGCCELLLGESTLLA
jgi:hypothetical protein